MIARRWALFSALAVTLTALSAAGCAQRDTRAPEKADGGVSTVTPPSGAPPESASPSPPTHEPSEVVVAPPASEAPSPPMRTPTDATVAPMPAPGSDDDLPNFGEYVYVEELPEPLKRVPPVMPRGALANGLEGTVLVQALVGRDGHVLRTRVTKSVPGLDAAAVDAVRQWVFKPARSNNRPVPVWVAVPVRFPPQ